MEPSSSKRMRIDTAGSFEPEIQDKRAGFHSLPTEIFLKIMSHLDTGDQRQGRLVCRRWNNTLSSWDEFMNKFRYLLRRSPSTDTHSTLRGSTSAWKHVALTKFNLDKSPDWYFPSYLNDTISSVILLDGILNWSWIKELAVRFPLLDQLAIVNCERKIKNDEGWVQTPEQFAGFNSLVQRLKGLKIELKEGLPTLNFYLKQFACPTSILVKIELSVSTVLPLQYYANIDPQEKEKCIIGFVELVSSCRSTLKSLIIRARSDKEGTPVILLRALTEKKINLMLDALNVSWDESSSTINQAEHQFLEFVRSQPNLKSLKVPLFGQPYSIPPPPDLASALPTHLHSVEFGCFYYITPQVFERLSETKAIIINVSFFPVGLPTRYLNQEIVQRGYPNLESFTINDINNLDMRIPLIQNIVNAFPNLIHLSLSCQDPLDYNTESITDGWVQAIIRDLSNLKVLRLDGCKDVTDQGVSGIPSVFVEDLQRKRTLYLEEDLATLNIEPTGLALSSLQNLQEVSIRGSSTQITDVGIRYGFDFKCLTKLTVSTGDNMSDWGLCQFGRLNRGLESCSIFTTSTIITPAAKTLLERSLPRLLPRNLIITTMEPETRRIPRWKVPVGGTRRRSRRHQRD